MRPRLLLLLPLALALAGCSVRVDDCKRPVVDFELDEELDEQTVERLVLQHQVIVHSELECELVCEEFYLDHHPKGGAQGVDTCEMTIDGEFTGDPDAIVGTMRCTGRGIPQFCVES